MEVGVLSSGYLILVDISVARFHGGSTVKWSIEASGYFPIFTVVKYLFQSDTCTGAEENDMKSIDIMLKLDKTDLIIRDRDICLKTVSTKI